MLDSDTLNTIATSPIPGEQPCGESVRYDEAFSKLEAEVGKLENPAGGDIDWRQIEEGAAELLTKTSKDVLLAAWLARAMWQRDGLAGLANGLETLRRMLETFWDKLHPQRIRPRRAAMEWLSEKLAAAIGEEQLASDPAGAARCVGQIEAIVAWSSDRFEGEDCGLLSLLSRLRSAPQPVEAAPPAVEAGDAPVAQTVVAGAPAGPIANRAQAIARLKELADWWAHHEPSSPMVPLLKRAVTWSDLDFQTLFGLLLRNRSDAKDYMWDVLGLNDEQTG